MIEFQNLDLGYEQAKNLFDIVQNNGGSILNNLKTNIDSLVKDWKGSDATEHINNLISINNSLNTFFDKSLDLLKNVNFQTIRVQDTRRRNGGSSVVGETLSKTLDIFNLNQIETTEEYSYNDALQTDYIKLVDLYNSFEKMITNFNSSQNELMGNWLAGCNREDAKSLFDEFLTASEEMKTKMKNARDNLEIACNNIKKLG